ncbi:hypothetical protein ACHAW5_004952 [Stephanodiscus triporus]|uniref:Uncharacterized protein n=1 Tax=Stephanodiscus triporus TaxID=2934178 RepID=A0ABD3P7Q7_9STRA
MTMINAYRIYKALVVTRTPDRRLLSMKEAIKEITFSLMQRGNPMRKREPFHPSPKVDLSRILGWVSGNKVRSDAEHQVAAEPARQEKWSAWRILSRMLKTQTWRTHQSCSAKAGSNVWLARGRKATMSCHATLIIIRSISMKLTAGVRNSSN